MEKLAGHMNKPPATEADVFYALGEIRKVLEHDCERKTSWVLTFFCDWALHTKLEGAGARQILRKLDERLSRFNPAEPGSIDPDGEVSQILSFDLLRGSLFEFCKRNDLPTAWAEDEFWWRKFVVLYGELVREAPLVVTRQEGNLTYLQKLVIAACEPSQTIVEANPGTKHYGFKWEFTLDDGRTFTLPYTSNYPEPPQGWRTQGLR